MGRSDFDAVFKKGGSRSTATVVVYALRVGEGPLRAGFTAARAIGGAVRRNRARRRVREAFRRLAGGVAGGWWVVVVARPRAVEAPFSEVLGGLERALAGFGLGRGRGGS